MRFVPHVLAVALVAAFLTALAAPLAAQQALPAEGNEADLLAVLQSDAELFDKAKACQRLAVIGTKESVPVLAELLSDAKMAHYARYALEPVPDPAVDDALRAALDKLDGALLVGVINSVGVRGDAKAVGQLKARLGSANADVVAASAIALGRIAAPEAIDALRNALGRPEPLRSAAAGACLTAADTLLAAGKGGEAAALYESVRKAGLPQYLQMSALAGAIRTGGDAAMQRLAECLQSDDRAMFRVGLQMAHEVGGAEVARLIMQQIELPESVTAPEGGAVILEAKYGAGDRWADATAAVIAAAEHGTPIVASNSLAGDPAPGTVKALRITYSQNGEQRTAEIAEGQEVTLEGVVPATLHPRQVLLISVLGDLGQKAALPVVLEAAQSGALDIRRAAVAALGRLGDASAVPVLIEAAVVPGVSQTARQSLIDLKGDDVDAAVAGALDGAEGQKRLVLIELAGDRAISQLVPALKKAADDPDPQVAKAAIGSLGATMSLGDLPVLIGRVVKSDAAETAAAAKEALKIAVLRMPDPNAAAGKLLDAMPHAPVAAQVDLLEVLGVTGGEKALAGVAAAAKTGSDDIQDAATRVLGEWMSPDVAPVLLDLARTGPAKHQVRCLRGYIRVFRQLGLPDDEKLDMAVKAFEAAQRDDERRLVLEALTRVPEPKALEMAVEGLGNPALKEAASQAAVAIAERIVASHPAAVADAMTKVLAAGPEAETAGKARRWLNEAKKRTAGN